MMLWNIGVKPRGGLLQSFTPQITYQPGGGATSYRKVADRVQETTSTTGTGTYTLAGAKDGFQSFAAVGDAAVTYYCCTDGTDYEIGFGTYTASGTTLARTSIIESSNSNAAVNWGSGDKDIFVTLPASAAVVQGVSLYQDNTATNPLQPGQGPVTFGPYSVAIGYDCLTNTNASYSLALGDQARTNTSRAVAIGQSYSGGDKSFAVNIGTNANSYGATGANSIAMGYLAKASGEKSVAIGRNVIADAPNAFVLGSYGDADGVGSRLSFGITGTVAAQQQMSFFTSEKTTSNATATVIGASDTYRHTLKNNSAHAFSGLLVARQQASGGTASAAWKVEGLIRREANAGTTTLVNSAITVLNNTPSWGVSLSANTSRGGLDVTCTGAASTNIRWVLTLHTSEVIYA